MPSQSQTSLWLFPAVFAAVMVCLRAYQFNVGGSQGWTPNPSESYNQWAERMRFQVNDTLFFKYKKGTDSVLVVSKEDYNNCNSENPILKMDGGDSVFKFNSSGPFYFITGNKDNCQKGQKLTTVVLSVRQSPTPPPSSGSPTPAVSPSPAPTTAPSPSPTPSPAPAVSPSPAPTTVSPSPTPSPAPAVSPSPSPTSLSPSPAPAGPTPAPASTPAASPSPTPNAPPSPPSSSSPSPSTPETPPPPAAPATQPPPPASTPGNDNSTSPPGSSAPAFSTNPSVLALIIIMASVTVAL